MARVPIEDRTPTAQWLIRSRATGGADYTVERFLADLAAEAGAAPSRSTYAQWESGKVTPRPASLRGIVEYWRRHGVDGPDAAPTTVPSADLAVALNALVGELRAWREEDRVRIEALEQTVADLLRRSLPSEAGADEPGRRARRVSAG